MNVRLTVALLFAAVLIFVAPARADRIRTGSGYGQTTSIAASQWSVCLPPDFVQCDLLVQINAPTNLDAPVQITLNNTLLPGATGFLNGEDGSSSPTFGLIDCATSFAAGDNLASSISFPGAPCGATTGENLSCGGITDNNGVFSIPASCVVAGETFYFDVQGTTVNPATIGPAGAPTAPEPSSLALLGISLIPLAFLSKRRLQA